MEVLGQLFNLVMAHVSRQTNAVYNSSLLVFTTQMRKTNTTSVKQRIIKTLETAG